MESKNLIGPNFQTQIGDSHNLWTLTPKILQLLNSFSLDLNTLLQNILLETFKIIPGTKAYFYEYRNNHFERVYSYPKLAQDSLKREKIPEELFFAEKREQLLFKEPTWIQDEKENKNFIAIPLRAQLSFNPYLAFKGKEKRSSIFSTSLRPVGMVIVEASHKVDLDPVFLDHLSELFAMAYLQWKLRQRATMDPLTGLYQRGYFEKLFQEEFDLSLSKQEPLSFLYLDIDKLQRINLEKSHEFGNQFLKNFSKKLASMLRGTDICSRSGGDEFMVLLPQTPGKSAFQVALKLLQRLTMDQSFPSFTFSIGVSELHLEGEDGPPQMMSRAERALFAAKREGGGRVVLWEPSLDKSLQVPLKTSTQEEFAGQLASSLWKDLPQKLEKWMGFSFFGEALDFSEKRDEPVSLLVPLMENSAISIFQWLKVSRLLLFMEQGGDLKLEVVLGEEGKEKGLI
ncbi:MAG: GGDEF domain-containing protein, partial [Planctomycetota bacterium]